MTSLARVVVVAAILGVALGTSGCLTTALVGLCVSSCGAGCVGATGVCPIADDGDAPAPGPVEVGPPPSVTETTPSEGADEG